MEKYPMKMLPVGKDYLWGGERLRTEYGKALPLHPFAESWELSCHPDGESRIADGPYAGRTLLEYVQQDWAGTLGTRAAHFQEFPILFKLIDAAQPLSVQVHPNDAYAQRTEGCYGKTEMWVVLQAEPGAEIFFGLEQTLTKEELQTRIANCTLPEVLHHAKARAGDVFFVQPGTLHAIGAGIVIAEIQQSSNLTYRVFDYGRLGADGWPRELHVEKALDVANLERCTEGAGRAFDDDDAQGRTDGAGDGGATGGASSTPRLLAQCPYFTVYSRRLHGTDSLLVDGESFACLFCAQGGGTLAYGGQEYALCKGETWFLPAALGEVALSGTAELLHIVV